MRVRELKKLGIYSPIVEFPCMEGEEWRPITEIAVPGVIPYYYISNYGRVFSCKRKMDLMNQSTAMEGYHTVGLRLKDGISRVYTVHRVMMLTFRYGEYLQFKATHPECEPQVNHIDGNKDHNYLDNLEWCTPSQNIQHAFDNGLKKQHHGDDCSFATITNAQAKKIAELLLTRRYTHKEISDMVGVPVHIVSSIASGSTWIDIYKEYNLNTVKNPPRHGFTDAELEALCQYIQDNKNKYSDLKQVYIEGIKVLFDMNYYPCMSTTMNRILNHQTRKAIVDKYDF